MQSIVSNEVKCLICEMMPHETHLYTHNVFYGEGREELSKQYGCWCYLCGRHHHMSNAGVHFNPDIDRKLKAHTQKRFNEVYPELDFVKIFGKDYLQDRR